ncbi:zinc-binding dehydrogenase [Amycolatopsis rhizosphaerae]|uniref:Zinc-binding dehydrogenase n=1 Tax=Amycolatopsis rhizosphaerae TaxID=2053003 RepID=A0A558B897_9PSEU|nr:zinc-binding dehydrogenase [Amycolatopsis rhizosphaerae]TVT32739.1 zinc-binding dehydrogenase [Amycolatopsis rhizosphaerae]
MRVDRFGGPEVLIETEVPEPVAGPGQVVVEVAVAAIDFVQTQLRRGISPGPPLPEPPYVPGATVAGTVAATGAGVDGAWLGRRVVTHTATGYGGNAERALSTVDSLVVVPDTLGLPEAAALFDDGGTALALAGNAAIGVGEWVLVEAAAGGLGSLLVQLAVHAGARVVGAARGARKLALVRDLGAEAAVDYSEPDWTDQVRVVTSGGPDVVFDGVGGDIGRAAFAITRPRGRFSIHGASSGSVTVTDPESEVDVIPLSQLFPLAATAKPRAERALAEAAAGRLRPVIGQTFPLAKAAEAHSAMENRVVTGKTLLKTQEAAA